MTEQRKLIVILIDGLSADYFEHHQARLPSLAALSSAGLQVRRLHSPIPATSMPGRVSMVTGRPSQEHGVFGNHVFDGESFRCAMPQDVAVPTIARRARDAGLRVASIGYAMMRPEDVDLYQPPWWLRGWMRGSRFAKVPSEAAVSSFLAMHGDAGELARSAVEIEVAAADTDDQDLQTLKGFACDQQVMWMVADLACSDTPPSLILTEIAMTDFIQHRFGYESHAAHWSLGLADQLVGLLVRQLELNGRKDEYVIAIASDHGHSPIKTAIFPDVVLPETLWQSEGATLHVAIRDAIHRHDVETRLLALGAESIGNDHVPERVRDQIIAFAAPDGQSFEESPAGHASQTPTGRPAHVSSHGFRPGAPADDRFCVFSGAGVLHSVVPTARAEQFCPTLASVLGLPEIDGNEGLPA